uniref:Core shell protein Gag P30 domain-containing protein n=1 Tax=Cyanoderma ruficeps TaxID=181631 RepID=A0A8C3R570_9PASS
PPIPRSSPLGCLLAHWKEGNFSQELRKDKLIDYCNVWWPYYVLSDNQRWPENGSLQSGLISELMLTCWWDPLPFPTPPRHRIPLHLPLPHLIPLPLPRLRQSKMLLLLILPSPPTPAQRFIPPPTPPQGYPPLPSTPTSPAPLPSGPLNPSPPESAAVSFPAWPRIGKGVLKTGKQKRTIIAPLRQGVGADGPVFVKVPFSPADLVIWKQSAGTYRDNPDKVARVVKMIMKTQNPDWEDIQVILDTLMDETERDMVLRAARERAREDIRNGLVTGTVDYNFPTEDPEWDPNDPSGVDMLRLKKYQEWICIGVQTAIPRSVNWSKLYEIRQEKKESPSAFLERLKETARKYTDLQIDSEQARVQLAFIFIGQSQEDIRKKLQKLEGEELRNLDKLLEVAWKVYNNRDKEVAKKQGQSLLAVLQGQGRGRGRTGRGGNRGGFGRSRGGLGIDQCAYCKMTGHWKRDFGNKTLTHEFLYMPGCPTSLLGRDL